MSENTENWNSFKAFEFCGIVEIFYTSVFNFHASLPTFQWIPAGSVTSFGCGILEIFYIGVFNFHAG